jgi:hypothetical protein
MRDSRLHLPTALRLALLPTLALIVAAFDPATTWWFPSCPFYAITGWLCPLCGSLRAVHALLVGDPFAALTFNPIVIVSLPMWIIARERTTLFCFSGRGVALMMTFVVLRNL